VGTGSGIGVESRRAFLENVYDDDDVEYKARVLIAQSARASCNENVSKMEQQSMVNVTDKTTDAAITNVGQGIFLLVIIVIVVTGTAAIILVAIVAIVVRVVLVAVC
jgi:hypothetical protein